MNIRAITFCAGLTLASVVAALCQPPPANDNFADRTALSGSSLTFSGTLAGATLETGEPTNACSALVSGGSVWWTWTAAESTAVVLAIIGDYSGCGSCNT